MLETGDDNQTTTSKDDGSTVNNASSLTLMPEANDSSLGITSKNEVNMVYSSLQLVLEIDDRDPPDINNIKISTNSKRILTEVENNTTSSLITSNVNEPEIDIFAEPIKKPNNIKPKAKLPSA